jgi:type IV pilus assembly protein PilB
MKPNFPVGNQDDSKKISTQEIENTFSYFNPEPVKFVDTVIRECIGLSASDILFEPGDKDLRARTRIDGVLYDLGRISLESYNHIAARIKVLCKLDPTEKKKIQEGQFILDFQGRQVNLRVEISQTIYGELIVVRVHEKGTIIMNLAQLGLSAVAQQNYQNILDQKNGLILVGGPTGCGKTTTLYSTISEINKGQRYNVMTIEDPVEFRLDGVNQMQVQEDVGFTFATGLRTILRLSPDIVLVGEIRDRETAEIAVESGLTGQLVFSTVHAQDSVGALFRLMDLDIEIYLLNSVLRGIVAQRLVRRVCENCREAYQPSDDEINLFNKVLGRPPKQLMKGKGCGQCQNLSFRGRTGIYEVLVMNAKIRDLLRKKSSEDELRDTLFKGGFATLLSDGLEKCEKGLTTVDEVLRNSLRTI